MDAEITPLRALALALSQKLKSHGNYWAQPTDWNDLHVHLPVMLGRGGITFEVSDLGSPDFDPDAYLDSLVLKVLDPAFKKEWFNRPLLNQMRYHLALLRERLEGYPDAN